MLESAIVSRMTKPIDQTDALAIVSEIDNVAGGVARVFDRLDHQGKADAIRLGSALAAIRKRIKVSSQLDIGKSSGIVTVK